MERNIVGPREDRCTAALSHYLLRWGSDKNQVLLRQRNRDLGVWKHMFCSIYGIPRGNFFQSRRRMAKSSSTQLSLVAQLPSTNPRKKGMSQHCHFFPQPLCKKMAGNAIMQPSPNHCSSKEKKKKERPLNKTAGIAS